MNGPNSIAKRVVAAAATGWGAVWLGAGVADAVTAGRSAAAGAASGPAPSAAAGGSGILSAGAGGAVTGRAAAVAGLDAGASRRCRKISFGRSLPPNQP